MSLTNMLDKDTEIKRILSQITPKKSDFFTDSGKEAFSSLYDLKVDYNLKSNYEASLVGIAFDYLARFRIAQITKMDLNLIHPLKAVDGLKIIQKDHPTENFESEYIDMGIKINKFIEKGKPEYSEELYAIALKCAKLEFIARNKYPDIDGYKNIPRIEELKIELANLIEVFEENFITSRRVHRKSKVAFNPKFGIGSILLGADADIIIDGILYDFKTTKSHLFNLKDAQQLSGYYLLNLFSNKVENHELISESVQEKQFVFEKLCMYKARFGEFEQVDLRLLFSEQEIDEALHRMSEFLLKSFNFSHKMKIMRANNFADPTEYERAIQSINDSN